MTVCIDSHIFIWGVKGEAAEGQSGMIKQAEEFFEWLDENKHEVLIPTPVIAEILSPEPPEKHASILDIINKNFRIASFDTMAAQKCAELIKLRTPDINEYKSTNGIRKEKMKFDYAIVAIALLNRAACIYSYDPDVKKFAQGLIEVREMPIIQKFRSQSLFDSMDMAGKPDTADDLPF